MADILTMDEAVKRALGQVLNGKGLPETLRWVWGEARRAEHYDAMLMERAQRNARGDHTEDGT